MLIKFKEPDPRAGMVARMDSSRGRQLVDAGAADQLTEAGALPEQPEQKDEVVSGGAEGKPKTARGKK